MMNSSSNFETFEKNKALFDQIVVFIDQCVNKFSSKKWIGYQNFYRFSVTIRFDSIWSTSISAQQNEYSVTYPQAVQKENSL